MLLFWCGVWPRIPTGFEEAVVCWQRRLLVNASDFFPYIGMIRQCIWIVDDRLVVIAVIQSMIAHGHQIRAIIMVRVSIF